MSKTKKLLPKQEDEPRIKQITAGQAADGSTVLYALFMDGALAIWNPYYGWKAIKPPKITQLNKRRGNE